jgi:hypothetical protein
MTQPNKREELAAMRLEDFKEHLRTIAGGSSEEISRAPRPNPLLGAQSPEGIARPQEKKALRSSYVRRDLKWLREILGNHCRQTQQSRLELGLGLSDCFQRRTIWIADEHRGD